jgi:hypothetical protein
MKFPNVPRFFRSMWRLARWFVLGRTVIVPEKVELERLSHCEKPCEWFDPESRQCLNCTCLVDLKTKISSEECPEGYWGMYLDKFRR